jgi:hypothetical protein
MNKIIFADVDGVLNTWTTQRRLECCHEFPFVDTRKVLRLREIVERTGAQIVLSSSWRTGDHPKAFWLEAEALRELRREFIRLRCPLWVDSTPILEKSPRQKEIYAWLLLHPEVDNFVILDDVGEELTFYKDHLVLTDPKVGLNKERMEFAIQLLGEKENE